MAPELRADIASLVSSFPLTTGFLVSNLVKEFRDYHGRPIPLQGFSSVLQLISTIPDAVQLVADGDDWRLFPAILPPQPPPFCSVSQTSRNSLLTDELKEPEVYISVSLVDPQLIGFLLKP